ncbi:hypothetical protein DNTS_005231 [Danionella cerebrum]|uniref:Uncharacterized protein n=1 Tax=Danionella cerebrum TaxID=2873325 RepID=A0A553QDD4_9TELE|nr:hypothetical protein DNTS_005231 [Danionella translucida]
MMPSSDRWHHASRERSFVVHQEIVWRCYSDVFTSVWDKLLPRSVQRVPRGDSVKQPGLSTENLHPAPPHENRDQHVLETSPTCCFLKAIGVLLQKGEEVDASISQLLSLVQISRALEKSKPRNDCKNLLNCFGNDGAAEDELLECEHQTRAVMKPTEVLKQEQELKLEEAAPGHLPSSDSEDPVLFISKQGVSVAAMSGAGGPAEEHGPLYLSLGKRAENKRVQQCVRLLEAQSQRLDPVHGEHSAEARRAKLQAALGAHRRSHASKPLEHGASALLRLTEGAVQLALVAGGGAPDPSLLRHLDVPHVAALHDEVACAPCWRHQRSARTRCRSIAAPNRRRFHLLSGVIRSGTSQPRCHMSPGRKPTQEPNILDPLVASFNPDKRLHAARLEGERGDGCEADLMGLDSCSSTSSCRLPAALLRSSSRALAGACACSSGLMGRGLWPMPASSSCEQAFEGERILRSSRDCQRCRRPSTRSQSCRRDSDIIIISEVNISKDIFKFNLPLIRLWFYSSNAALEAQPVLRCFLELGSMSRARQFGTAPEDRHGDWCDHGAGPDARRPAGTPPTPPGRWLEGSGSETDSDKHERRFSFSVTFRHMSDLPVVRLAEGGGGVQPNPPLSSAAQALALSLHVQDIGVEAADQRSFHHCPVLRVQVHVPDVPASPRSHETFIKSDAPVQEAHTERFSPVARSCPRSCVLMPTMISMVACDRKFFSQNARSQPSLRAFCQACGNTLNMSTEASVGSFGWPSHHLEGSEQGHVIAEGVGSEALPAQHGQALLSSLRRLQERLAVRQSAGDGQDGIQTLEHHGTHHHLPQVRIHRQVCQVHSQLREVLPRVHSVDRLQPREKQEVTSVSLGTRSQARLQSRSSLAPEPTTDQRRFGQSVTARFCDSGALTEGLGMSAAHRRSHLQHLHGVFHRVHVRRLRGFREKLCDGTRNQQLGVQTQLLREGRGGGGGGHPQQLRDLVLQHALEPQTAEEVEAHAGPAAARSADITNTDLNISQSPQER